MMFITVFALRNANTYGNLQSMKLAAAEKRTLNFLQFCLFFHPERNQNREKWHFIPDYLKEIQWLPVFNHET